MTNLRLSDMNGPSPVFLVERYLPPAAARNLADSVSRTAQLCELSAHPGADSHVQYLSSVYLPTEDTCFCLFRATTAGAVCGVNDQGGFALDRITAAVLLYPTHLTVARGRKGQIDTA